MNVVQNTQKVKNTALFISILKDNIEIVQLLLENENIDVNKKSLKDSENYHCEITPLFIAAKKKKMKLKLFVFYSIIKTSI